MSWSRILDWNGCIVKGLGGSQGPFRTLRRLIPSLEAFDFFYICNQRIKIDGRDYKRRESKWVLLIWFGMATFGSCLTCFFFFQINQRQLDMLQILFVLQPTPPSIILILHTEPAIQTNGNKKTSNFDILRGKTPILHPVLVDLLNQRLEVLNHLWLPIWATVVVLHCLGMLYRGKELAGLESLSLEAGWAFVWGREFFDLALDLKLGIGLCQSSLLSNIDLVGLTLVSSLSLLDDIWLDMVYLKWTHLLESIQVLRPETDELTEGSALGLVELGSFVALTALSDIAELFSCGLLLRLFDFYCLVDTLDRFREDLILINNPNLVVLNGLTYL